MFLKAKLCSGNQLRGLFFQRFLVEAVGLRLFGLDLVFIL